MYLITLTLIVINFLLASVHTSRVFELSDGFLDIRKEGIWLVKFYAPWCGHCKKLEPIYSHVAQALAATPVRVARVDCTRFPAVGKEFGITGYPTVMFIKATSNHIYTGDRTVADMTAYAKRMMGAAVKPLGELETTDEPYLVYKGDKKGTLWEIFEKVATQNQHALQFFVEEGGEAEIHLHHPYPSNQSPMLYTSTEDMQTFINTHKFPKFLRITSHNFQEVMASKKLIVMGVVEEDKLGRILQPDFVTFLEKFVEERGSEFRGYQFGYTPSPTIGNSIAMYTLSLPSLIVLNTTTFQHHIHAGNLTSDALQEFIHLISTEQLPPLGGSSMTTRMYRTYYEATTHLGLMFAGNPVLTTLMFGLPMGFLTIIFYSICCSEVLDAEDEEVEDDHVKRE